MNEKGKVLENSRINNNLKQVGRSFDENINDEKVRVVMESSSVWYNIYSYLSEEKHLNVVLSNPNVILLDSATIRKIPTRFVIFSLAVDWSLIHHP